MTLQLPNYFLAAAADGLIVDAMTLDLNQPRFYADFELGSMLVVSAKQVREWARHGQIPHTLLPDGSMVFPRDMVDAWLLERTRPATGAHGILIQ